MSPPELSSSSFKVGARGLNAVGTPTQSEWLRFGRVLARQKMAVHFAVGDWVNYGFEKYGDVDHEAVALMFGWSVETVKRYAKLASRIPWEVRNENLGVRYHILVAPFSPAVQSRWLGKASREGWSVDALRRHVMGEQKRGATYKLVVECGGDAELFDTLAEHCSSIGARWRKVVSFRRSDYVDA